MSYWLKLTGILLIPFAVAIVAVQHRESSARGRFARIQFGMSANEVHAVMGRNPDHSVDWNKVSAIGPVMGDANDAWYFAADQPQVWVAYKENRGIDKSLGSPAESVRAKR